MRAYRTELPWRLRLVPVFEFGAAEREMRIPQDNNDVFALPY